MYKCYDCGAVFESPASHEEDRGEFWGFPCSETVNDCPNCGGDYEEVFQCEKCGEYFFEDELHSDVCDDCIDVYKNNIDVCFKIGDEDTEVIKINCFLATMFNTWEIEAILYNHLKSAGGDVDCSPFIDNDRSWFAEKILEREVSENENTKG